MALLGTRNSEAVSCVASSTGVPACLAIAVRNVVIFLEVKWKCHLSSNQFLTELCQKLCVSL